MLWVVAGCLFEVSFRDAGGRVEWVEPGPEVSLLDEVDRDGAHHFRFRAEAAGQVDLRFVGGDGASTTVTVNIAPER